jgi:hypothetical protein
VRQEELKKAETSKSKRAELRAMAEADLLFYVNFFCWTLNPREIGAARQPFVTWPVQNDLLIALDDAIAKQRPHGTKKSRDQGATWIHMATIDWRARFRKWETYLVASRKAELVDGGDDTLFGFIRFIDRHLPEWMQDEVKFTKFNARYALTDSWIEGEATNPSLSRGKRKTGIIIDEASQVPDMQAVNQAAQNAADCRLYNSTPWGRHTVFRQLEKRIRFTRIHWSQHGKYRRGLYTWPSRDPVPTLLDNYRGEIDVAIAGNTLGDVEWKTYRFPDNYPFVREGTGLFGAKGKWLIRSPWFDGQVTQALDESQIDTELELSDSGGKKPLVQSGHLVAFEEMCRPPVSTGSLIYDFDTMAVGGWLESPSGDMRLWIPVNVTQRPPVENEYVVGADISHGAGASNSCLAVIDARTATCVGELATPHKDPKTFAHEAVAYAIWFNNARLIWDANGPGGSEFRNEVDALGYYKIYYRFTEEQAFKRKKSNNPGVRTQNRYDRTAMLRNLVFRMTRGKYTNHSREMIDELAAYGYNGDMSVSHQDEYRTDDPSGARDAHGDRVIAHSVALQANEFRETPILIREQEKKGPQRPDLTSIAGRRLLANRTAPSLVFETNHRIR